MGVAGTGRDAPAWARRTLAARWLGRVDYPSALETQAELVEKRRRGEVPDTLLLLEHPHVVTIGSSGRPSDVLLSSAELSARGIDVHRVGRGGEVTYHGPGQLVGYPVLDLKPDAKDLHLYLRRLERALIAALSDFGVVGTRGPATGVWVDGAKVASIGIRVSSGWITSHGFALNASTDLEYFDAIVPCGVRRPRIASVSRLLGRRVSPRDMAPGVARAVARAFGYGAAPDVDLQASGGADSKIRQ